MRFANQTQARKRERGGESFQQIAEKRVYGITVKSGALRTIRVKHH